MEPNDVLFSIAVYRNGQVVYSGAPRGDAAADTASVLRTLAEAIETGHLVLTPAPVG